MATITVLADSVRTQGGSELHAPRITGRDLRVRQRTEAASFRNQSRFGLRQPEGHIHGAVEGMAMAGRHGPAPHGPSGGTVCRDAVAVRLERPHAQFLRPGPELLVVVCGKRAIRKVRRTVSAMEV